MKVFLIAFVLCCSGALAQESAPHPADAAGSALKSAEMKLDTALARMQKALDLVEDRKKQAACKAAFDDAQKQWREHVDAELALYLQMTALPDTATSVTLSSYHQEARSLEARAKALEEAARFLEANSRYVPSRD